MLYALIVVLHVVGALVTALVGARSLFVVWFSKHALYRSSSLSLGALAVFEVLTGTLLSVLSSSISAAYICERVAIYLALVALIECLLFERMKRNAIAFPFVQIGAPVMLSLGFLASAAAAGF